ncbi:hypothetical protein BJX66DRAFT_316247 [Aspergillus keveii]|uniref:EF-hand domain-containing protein n=1 Tax=Aspergillus keveii TaxID=714993 RepID=A0ABR4FNC7_9EURO
MSESNRQIPSRAELRAHLSPDFDMMDTDNDGRLDFDEFKQAIRGAVPEEHQDAFARMMFSEIDTNADEKISLDEFVDGYTEWMMTKI